MASNQIQVYLYPQPPTLLRPPNYATGSLRIDNHYDIPLTVELTCQKSSYYYLHFLENSPPTSFCSVHVGSGLSVQVSYFFIYPQDREPNCGVEVKLIDPNTRSTLQFPFSWTIPALASLAQTPQIYSPPGSYSNQFNQNYYVQPPLQPSLQQQPPLQPQPLQPQQQPQYSQPPMASQTPVPTLNYSQQLPTPTQIIQQQHQQYQQQYQQQQQPPQPQQQSVVPQKVPPQASNPPQLPPKPNTQTTQETLAQTPAQQAKPPSSLVSSTMQRGTADNKPPQQPTQPTTSPRAPPTHPTATASPSVHQQPYQPPKQPPPIDLVGFITDKLDGILFVKNPKNIFALLLSVCPPTIDFEENNRLIDQNTIQIPFRKAQNITSPPVPHQIDLVFNSSSDFTVSVPLERVAKLPFQGVIITAKISTDHKTCHHFSIRNLLPFSIRLHEMHGTGFFEPIQTDEIQPHSSVDFTSRVKVPKTIKEPSEIVFKSTTNEQFAVPYTIETVAQPTTTTAICCPKTSQPEPSKPKPSIPTTRPLSQSILSLPPKRFFQVISTLTWMMENNANSAMNENNHCKTLHVGPINRNINPYNISLTESDRSFTVSFNLIEANQFALTSRPTSFFLPPEKLWDEKASSSDVWSLGMIIYIFVKKIDVSKQFSYDLDLLVLEGVPLNGLADPFRSLLEGCLAHEPKDRWSLSRLSAELQKLCF